MKLSLAAAAGCILVIFAAPAANAFTMDNQSNTKAGGGARYTDPDAQFDGSSATSGQKTLRNGNTTFQFGSQPSFEQRYDQNKLFDPLARDR